MLSINNLRLSCRNQNKPLKSSSGAYRSAIFFTFDMQETGEQSGLPKSARTVPLPYL